MRFIDSGSRDATQAVGAWLQQELTSDVVELRWQSGYFVSDALGLFAPTLQRLAADNHRVRVLIGSNESGTLWTDVLQLCRILGLPQANAELGVVQYANGLFHPKIYHLVRADGTQSAYVGSSNLTEAGLSGLNIEAGITTRSLRQSILGSPRAGRVCIV
jgi:PLD-like domain